MAVAADQPTSIRCSSCGAESTAKPTKRGNARLPSGWKRAGAETLCPKCKSARFRLRAVTFPVASVIGAGWKDFQAALKEAWARSTELSNWAVRQLLLADGDRRRGQGKMEKLPRVNLYGAFNESYHDRAAWHGAAQAANSVLHAVEQKYRKSRYEVLWLNSDRPPRYNYPTPYPVHNAAWKAEYLETEGGKVPAVAVTVGGTTFTILLRGGPTRKRQLAAFAWIASLPKNMQKLRGELAIYRRRSSEGSHRRSAPDRQNGGGPRVSYRVMVKLVAWLPTPERTAKAEGSLEVRTGRKALLVATVPGWERPWLYHADQLRGVIKNHQRRLQSISDDLKAESRPASPALREHLRTMAYRMRCRLESETRRMAAMVVGLAKRQRLAAIYFNDADKRYMPSFPWHTLAKYIEEACDNEGLRFHHASAPVVESEEGDESNETNGGGES